MYRGFGRARPSPGAFARTEDGLDAPPLAPDDLERLAAAGWPSRVGDRDGIWVRVARQELWVVRGGRRRARYACSTARAGIDGREGSGGTPDGWLEVGEKIGSGLPSGAILRARRFSGAVHDPGHETEEDLVLTRILRLRGLEPGRNLGGGVDTWRRMIYIHGTNREDRLGTPASHGCVRLANPDVIELFDLVPAGCSVLVTAE